MTPTPHIPSISKGIENVLQKINPNHHPAFHKSTGSRLTIYDLVMETTKKNLKKQSCGWYLTFYIHLTFFIE